VAERLERASTGRARCRLCKEPIDKGALRMGVSGDSGSFDGTMMIWHHVLCAALERPAVLLRASALSNEIPAAVRAPLEAVANIVRAKKLVRVLWRHASEPRCLLELAGDRYTLVTELRGEPLVVRGALDEVIASVPDEDLEGVVDTAVAAGKSLPRAR